LLKNLIKIQLLQQTELKSDKWRARQVWNQPRSISEPSTRTQEPSTRDARIFSSFSSQYRKIF